MATSYHKNVGKIVVLALVGLHLLAIGYYRIAKKEDLVRPMIVGDKQVATPVSSARDSAQSRLLALGVLCLCALVVYGLVGLGTVTGF
jgi:quinol-cytochrome oxidoreductase complex cytochrome b subunit